MFSDHHGSKLKTNKNKFKNQKIPKHLDIRGYTSNLYVSTKSRGY